MEDILQLIRQFHNSTSETERDSILLEMKALDARLKQKKILVNQVNKFQKLRNKIKGI
jgi:hypothetical protein